MQVLYGWCSSMIMASNGKMISQFANIEGVEVWIERRLIETTHQGRVELERNEHGWLFDTEVVKKRRAGLCR